MERAPAPRNPCPGLREPGCPSGWRLHTAARRRLWSPSRRHVIGGFGERGALSPPAPARTRPSPPTTPTTHVLPARCCCCPGMREQAAGASTLSGDDRVHVAPALPLRRCGGWHQRLLLLLPLRRCDRCAACQRPALQRRAAASGRRRSERNAEAGGAATSPRPGAERCLLQPPPGKHTGQRTRAEPTARRSSPRAA